MVISYANLTGTYILDVLDRQSPNELDLNHSLLNSSFDLSVSLYQMDEEKASVEDLLRRGEELLQQTSDDGQREELRLLLLRLQSQYSSRRVRRIKKICCVLLKPRLYGNVFLMQEIVALSHIVFASCAMLRFGQYLCVCHL